MREAFLSPSIRPLIVRPPVKVHRRMVLPACTEIVAIRRISWLLSGHCRDPWQQRVSVSRVLLRLWAMHRDDLPEDILTPSKFDAGEGYRQAGAVPIVSTISAGCRKTMSGRAVTSASPRVYPPGHGLQNRTMPPWPHRDPAIRRQYRWHLQAIPPSHHCVQALGLTEHRGAAGVMPEAQGAGSRGHAGHWLRCRTDDGEGDACFVEVAEHVRIPGNSEIVAMSRDASPCHVPRDERQLPGRYAELTE